jgi:transposase-like protein
MSKKVWPKKVKSPMQKFTIKDFRAAFPDDDACLEWLRNFRWAERFDCPNCQKSAKFYRITTKKVYGCEHCGYQISPTADTIYHKSSTSLTTWFYVIYLMAQTRGGISAKQIERETGVTYKTAWRMCKMIRERLGEDFAPFGGDVEVDESYFGGKKRGGKRGRGTTKTPVVGVVERKGRIEVKAVENVRRDTILPFVSKNVALTAGVFTDEFQVYSALPSMGYQHETVPHAEKVYVIGNAHTNTIEGFWSNCKNGIRGVYHAVSVKYLQHYLNEYSFRYNHRNDSLPMFWSFLTRSARTT